MTLCVTQGIPCCVDKSTSFIVTFLGAGVAQYVMTVREITRSAQEMKFDEEKRGEIMSRGETYY